MKKSGMFVLPTANLPWISEAMIVCSPLRPRPHHQLSNSFADETCEKLFPGFDVAGRGTVGGDSAMQRQIATYSPGFRRIHVDGISIEVAFELVRPYFDVRALTRE